MIVDCTCAWCNGHGGGGMMLFHGAWSTPQILPAVTLTPEDIKRIAAAVVEQMAKSAAFAMAAPPACLSVDGEKVDDATQVDDPADEAQSIACDGDGQLSMWGG